MNRRNFLRSLAVAPLATAWPQWMPRLAFAPEQSDPRGDLLVVVFLRGAADGLNMVVPHGEEAYYRLRPTINIARPDDSSALKSGRALDLDGFFGLHPSLAALLPAWQAEQMALIHACGAPDVSRSHFKAMALMERGVENERGPASGWIGRHLATLNTGNTSPLRAIGLGSTLPQSMVGSVPATALQSIVDFHLSGDVQAAAQMQAVLSSMYAGAAPLAVTGSKTLGVLNTLEKLDPASYMPQNGAAYPDSAFGSGLRQIAMLARAEVGLEVAAIDLGGWDTHYAQGGSVGLMALSLADLGQGLAAFHADVIDGLGNVTLVVMSEFGRRAKENAGLGTDHGHGGVLWLLGDSVQGGRVHTRWPGLAEGQLFGPGDLAVTTDYRDVLAEVLQKRLGNHAVADIFPNYAVQGVGVVR